MKEKAWRANKPCQACIYYIPGKRTCQMHARGMRMSCASTHHVHAHTTSNQVRKLRARTSHPQAMRAQMPGTCPRHAHVWAWCTHVPCMRMYQAEAHAKCMRLNSCTCTSHAHADAGHRPSPCAKCQACSSVRMYQANAHASGVSACTWHARALCKHASCARTLHAPTCQTHTHATYKPRARTIHAHARAMHTHEPCTRTSHAHADAGRMPSPCTCMNQAHAPAMRVHVQVTDNDTFMRAMRKHASCARTHYTHPRAKRPHMPRTHSSHACADAGRMPSPCACICQGHVC